jgi:hypothetical protein
MTITLNVQTGNVVTQNNGGGRICATAQEQSQLQSATLALELCQLDAELMSIMTGGSMIECGGDPIGYLPKRIGDTQETPVCLEIWSRAWDGGGQATLNANQGTANAPAFYHWVFPSVTWTPGNVTMDVNVHVIPVDGTALENTCLDANGPYDDWPQCVIDAGGVASVYGWWLDGAPPDAACGSITVPVQAPQVPATGANAGIPGSWTPAGSQPPASVSALAAGNPNTVVASPTTAWTTGQYVQTRTAGAVGEAFWNGTTWINGRAT